MCPPPDDDSRFMAQALKLAQRGRYTTQPNPRVGCVLVRHGEIVGRGWHKKAGQAHAEIRALAQAGARAKGSTAYVTLEPCCHHGRTPPCTDALLEAGIARVVVATEDPSAQVAGRGLQALQRAGLEVRSGVCAAAAQHLNRGFFKRVTRGRPWVVLKMAASLDGRTALQNGASQWITSAAARHDAHKLRASSAAIMTGVGTVLHDDPQMTARLKGVSRQPLRVILDSQLRTPQDARILDAPGEVLLVAAAHHVATHSARCAAYRARPNVTLLPLASDARGLDLAALMHELGRRQVNEVMLEAGARLCGSMLAQGWVDEMVVYLSPDVLGNDARGMFAIPLLESMQDKSRWRFTGLRRLGRDYRMNLLPEPLNG